MLLALQSASGQVRFSPAGAAIINVYGSAPASKCIDDNVNSFCHSLQNQVNPWLEIDLGSSKAVTQLLLYNRADCCQDRLSNFEVWVGNTQNTGGATI